MHLETQVLAKLCMWDLLSNLQCNSKARQLVGFKKESKAEILQISMISIKGQLTEMIVSSYMKHCL